MIPKNVLAVFLNGLFKVFLVVFQPHQEIYKSADRAEIGTFGTNRQAKHEKHDVQTAQEHFVQQIL